MDMDAFFASVEQRDRPELRGRPVIVGGTSRRAVVSTASYEARVYGVRSAMPVFEAERHCPHGVFLPVRMDRYREVSRQVMEVLEGFSPRVEQVSIDEAYLDLSGAERLFGPPETVASTIKQCVLERTGLTCSIGIAPNRFLAKIASDMDKPDGLTWIRPRDVRRVLSALPIRNVPGIGEKTTRQLEACGIVRMGDVEGAPEGTLRRVFGTRWERMRQLSQGLDPTPVIPSSPIKSISREQTLARDTSDLRLLKAKLLVLAEGVGEQARRKGVLGSTVTLKLRRSDFSRMTRSTTLSMPTSSTRTLFDEGVKLLGQVLERPGSFRLIGIGLSHLRRETTNAGQLSLFGEPGSRENPPWEAAEHAMDQIRERFGKDAIIRGRFLKKQDP